MDPRLVEVYTEVGKFLKRYKSGALPKVVKILPGLSNWDEVRGVSSVCMCLCLWFCVFTSLTGSVMQMLFLTDPDGWSNHAVRAITRIFASNLNHRMAQRCVCTAFGAEPRQCQANEGCHGHTADSST